MLKKYISNTILSINAKLSDGNYTHVSFSPKSLTGSVFYTSDEALQKALEKHPYFGTKFKMEEMQKPVKQEEVNPKKAESGDVMKHVDAPCADVAKEYLASNFDESRTKLRSIKFIKAIGLKHNIMFDGPDFNYEKE